MPLQSQSAKTARPWRMAIPLISVIIIALLWTIYWFTALHFIKKEVASQRQTLAAQGMGLDCARESWGGFPFRFTFECDEPKRTQSGDPSGVSLAAKKLTVYIQAWKFRHVIARLDGPTEAGSPLNMTATHGPILASTHFFHGTGMQTIVEIPDLKIPGLLDTDRLVLSTIQANGVARFAINGTGLKATVPNAGLVALDGLDIELSAPEVVVNAPDPLAFMAETNSHIDLGKLALTQGKFRLDGTGSAGLDGNRMPIGKIDLYTNNLEQLLSQLAQLEIISNKDGRTALAMSGLMPKDKDGRIALSLEAHDGGLYWGPVKLLTLAPVR